MAPILIYSRDMGGTNLMIAVHDYLTEVSATRAPVTALDAFLATAVGVHPDTADVVVIAKDYALPYWRRSGIDAKDFYALSANKESRGAVDRLIESVQPAAILTATTDVDDRTDLHFWRSAAERSIPTAAFVDHRVNLHARFFDAKGDVHYPGKIFVIDRNVMRRIVDEGVPEELVEVVGDLHIQRLAKAKESKQLTKRVADLRQSWGAEPTTNVLLFVSECLREMRALGAEGTSYDEIESLTSLLARLRDGEGLAGRGLPPDATTLVIRPHPKDAPGKYEKFAAAGPLKVVIDGGETAEVALRAADVVIGMNSTMLEEARALGRPVYSNCRASADGGVIVGPWTAL